MTSNRHAQPITAVETLILLQECVLRLDDPVDELLPAHRPITVRDLLTFRMGFGGYFGPAPINPCGARIPLGFLTAAYASIRE